MNKMQIKYKITENIKYFLLLVLTTFSKSIEFNNINAGFINSVGWSEKPNIYIHLFAPFVLNPKIGTRIRSRIDMKKNIKMLFLAKFLFISDIIKTKNIDITTKVNWCLKKWYLYIPILFATDGLKLKLNKQLSDINK